eukprot:UN33789
MFAEKRQRVFDFRMESVWFLLIIDFLLSAVNIENSIKPKLLCSLQILVVVVVWAFDVMFFQRATMTMHQTPVILVFLWCLY